MKIYLVQCEADKIVEYAYKTRVKLEKQFSVYHIEGNFIYNDKTKTTLLWRVVETNLL